MKNISVLKLDKYNELSNYLMEEDGVYKDLRDTDVTNYRIALSFELENGEDEQYPLEDILDKYYLYVSDFLEQTNNFTEKLPNVLKLELAGELEDIQDVKYIIGKRVYNESFIKEDGKNYVRLVIE
jgi:hypothetical protein